MANVVARKGSINNSQAMGKFTLGRPDGHLALEGILSFLVLWHGTAIRIKGSGFQCQDTKHETIDGKRNF
jgi:hypothetical protein